MRQALFWGLVAGSSLVLDGHIGLNVRIPPRWIGVIMALGAGVLISAVAYELSNLPEAFERGSESASAAHDAAEADVPG